jgi:hypothetical protein
MRLPSSSWRAPCTAGGWSVHTLGVWGVLVLVSLGLVGALRRPGVTSDGSLTNHPESATAQKLIDARLP